MCLDINLLAVDEMFFLVHRSESSFAVCEHHMPIWEHVSVAPVYDNKGFFYRSKLRKIRD